MHAHTDTHLSIQSQHYKGTARTNCTKHLPVLEFGPSSPVSAPLHYNDEHAQPKTFHFFFRMGVSKGKMHDMCSFLLYIYRMSAAAPENAGSASLFQRIDCGPNYPSPNLVDIANTINQAFLSPMSTFTPLTSHCDSIQPVSGSIFEVSEQSVFKKLCGLNPSKATGPDGIPGWLLKENAELLASPVFDILNALFRESRLPLSWKEADIVPIPKQKPVYDVNKNLRPISLTPVLSKLSEDYVVEDFVKPAVLAKVDRRQLGTVQEPILLIL